MFKKLTLATVIVATLLIVTAQADWFPGDGHKMHYPQMPNAEGWAVNATVPIVLADDWMCSETGWIKDFHFWGGWKNGIEGIVDSFVLSIHSDIPAEQNPDGYSKPGETLWEHAIVQADYIVRMIEPTTLEGWYDPLTGEFLYEDHQLYYQYNVFLPEQLWFWQEEGTIYWVNITAFVNEVETQWGWKSTLDHWNDDAVWGEWGLLNWVEMYEPGTGYPYIPGDVNGDGLVDGNDVTYLQNFLFGGGPPPPYSVGGVYPAADVNGDCVIDTADLTYLVNFVNGTGPAPVYCPQYPPGDPVSLDLAFVVTGEPPLEVDSCEYYKAPYLDYAPYGMPDFDQKQGSWIYPPSGAWSHCGPTALANCFWWFDSKFEPAPLDPRPFFPDPAHMLNDGYPLLYSLDPTGGWDDHDTNNVVPFIDSLAMYSLTNTANSGTNIFDLANGAQAWLNSVGLGSNYLINVYAIDGVEADFEFIRQEVLRSQDVILLLGFWQEIDPGLCERVGGHYVTVAGTCIDPIDSSLCISDPYLDMHEGEPPAGSAHGSTVHNDASNISGPHGTMYHDKYPVSPASCVSMMPPFFQTELPTYPAGMNVLTAFYGQNLYDPTQTPMPPQSLTTHTIVEYALVICPDQDGDGWSDDQDNCPTVYNPAQTDTDSDGQGDACDPDDDNDGVLDGVDTNPTDPTICEDVDGDSCDDCAIGTDGFGPLPDNLPANDGTDTDGDGLCDAGDPDDDNDGVLDGSDSAPLDPTICEDIDSDSCDDCAIGTDGFGPLPDNLPANDGPDTDGDGLCDAGDPDDDNDGVPDGSDTDPIDPDVCEDVDSDGCDDCAVGSDDFGPLPDNFPANDGPDNDGDGLCDTGDPDDDNDGVLDGSDTDPIDPDVCEDVDSDGCDDCAVGSDDFGPLPDNFPANDGLDTDSDGICDAGDNCPNHYNPLQEDSDSNGVGDSCEVAICDCIPGDATGNSTHNILDITYLIAYLYSGGPAPAPYPLCSGDANCNCAVNILDITYLIAYLYSGGPAPCDCTTWLSICGTPLRK